MLKLLTVWITTNCGKSLDKNTRPPYLYADQEATIRTGCGTIGWFKIGKGIFQGCILSPYSFNLYAVYITWNTKLLVLQALIKIVKRNVNNFRYENDTTLMVESKGELKNLLMMVKEESEKSGLKLNIQKTKIMISNLITLWQIEGEKSGRSNRFCFLGLQNHCKWWL